MKRDIFNELMKWKDSRRRKPLLVTGVRQCGKTYIIKQFGEKYFNNCVTVNFEGQSKYSEIFEYDFDVERIIKEIKMITKEEIVLGKTLLFFDEIQECPRAITALKYFCENLKELHIICAGSLLGVALKQENISFPVGKVNRIRLYPMSFKEFVIACGNEEMIDILKDWNTYRIIPELYSVPMQKMLKDYYIVGGMPEAVQTWIDTKDYDEVDAVLKEILDDYADDFSKHSPIIELPKIRWIWDSVPVQLAKDNNKFVFSHVKKGKRAAELENAMQWLKDAGLIYPLELVEKPETPLSAFADASYFKVYMSDIGLLRVRSNVSYATILYENDNYIRYKGAFAENYVNNELTALGKNPFFWRSGNTAEIDFMYDGEESFIPVEVKAADNTQAKSYRQFCKRYVPKKGFKLSMKNIAENMCEETITINLPLYMTWNIEKYEK